MRNRNNTKRKNPIENEPTHAIQSHLGFTRSKTCACVRVFASFYRILFLFCVLLFFAFILLLLPLLCKVCLQRSKQFFANGSSCVSDFMTLLCAKKTLKTISHILSSDTEKKLKRNWKKIYQKWTKCDFKDYSFEKKTQTIKIWIHYRRSHRNSEKNSFMCYF